MSVRYLGLLSLSACLIGGYGGKHYVADPAASVKGAQRDVVVGARYRIDASGDTDLTIAMSARPLCRQAVFGDRITHRQWQRDRRGALDVTMMVAGSIATLAGMTMLMVGLGDSTKADPTVGGVVAASGIYFGGLGYTRFTLDPESFTGEDEIARSHDASEWRGDVRECTEEMPVALIPRTLTIDVKPVHGAAYNRRVVSEASGRAAIPRFMAQLATVALECGGAQLTITDTTDDPPRDAEQSPDRTKVYAERAPAYEQSIEGNRALAIDTLPETERRIAEQCHSARIATCEAQSADPELDAGCEDTCARDVNTTRCVLASRDCVASAAAVDKPICADGYSECLASYGVTRADVERCVSRCVHAVRTTECQ